VHPSRRLPLVWLAASIVAFAVGPLAPGAPATRARAVVLMGPAPPAATEFRSPAGAPHVAEVADPPRGSGRYGYLLVRIERETPIRARPGGGRVVGTMPAGSRYYDEPTVAWVRRLSSDGRFGLVSIPYSASRDVGWLRLRGLERSWTRIGVVADLSEHRITVRRGDDVLFRAAAATGAAASPTPTGRYFVTDRVAFPAGGVLGTYAFGLSGIQPHLPAGWSGGDQLAIHGTNAPASIGTSASAGCLRVSERVLDRLRPLLRLGTPVNVRA
jgi:hypothetical protein